VRGRPHRVVSAYATTGATAAPLKGNVVRTVNRLVILITLIAAGLTAAAAAEAALAARPAPPTEADMLGLWTGTVTLDRTSDVFDGGVIVIARDAGRLTATVGPNERVRFRSSRLSPTDRGLRFEVAMPDDDETRLLVYDLTFADGTMTGTVTFVRHGLTAPGHLTFTRQ
jgi:hypothetical protein